MPIGTVVVAVVSTIALGALVAQKLGLGRSFGVLSGGAVGICGASAALAIASVLPRTPESERDTILTVVTVTLLSTIAMIVYPLFVTALGFDHIHAGIFLGGTIHDVAQVVGAGYSISPEPGDVATYVKLVRVSMLLPVVFSIAFVVGRRAKSGRSGAKVNLPLFLVGFAALVALNSFGLLPKVATDLANDVSRWSLVTAIAALGSTALTAFSSGLIWVKAMREASSMQTWTNSQPTPRRLLWPLRSPVMRWPTRSKRPSFLMSIWINSPGFCRS